MAKISRLAQAHDSKVAEDQLSSLRFPTYQWQSTLEGIEVARAAVPVAR